jgi:hypothetical protein
MRSEIKALESALAAGKSADIQKQYIKAQSAIDTAVKKNVIHKNKAARKKAQLSAKVKTLIGAKPKTATKPAAKKPAAKPKATTAKKATPKKAA